MSAKTNGFWDFKSYDEKSWFRDLIYLLSFLLLLYSGLHYFLKDRSYTFEYTKLNTEQLQFINRLYIDSAASKPAAKPCPKCDSAKKKTDTTRSPCPCKCVLCKKVADYLQNAFENKIDTVQMDTLRKFLCEATPQEASTFLAGTRFKVGSYFWLIGPSVYWEVVFWSLFGVLCNLLFMLGAVGSDTTTDLGNPQTQFDSSEILGQVAKIFYAPLCTLVVILGYNFFKDANIVDIDSSKGLLVFAFIGGFYSSRVISLMDRLKDVLLPNSGTASLPPTNQVPAMLQQLKVQLSTVLPLVLGAELNSAIVTITPAASNTPISGSHMAADPDGLFTFSSLAPGNYIIHATLDALSGSIPGAITSTTAPINLIIK